VWRAVRDSSVICRHEYQDTGSSGSRRAAHGSCRGSCTQRRYGAGAPRGLGARRNRLQGPRRFRQLDEEDAGDDGKEKSYNSTQEIVKKKQTKKKTKEKKERRNKEEEEEKAEGHNFKKIIRGILLATRKKKSLHAAQNLNSLLLTPSVLAGCISMFKSVELNIIEQTISSWAFGINGLYLLLHFVFVDR